jgi:hypothetical protein
MTTIAQLPPVATVGGSDLLPLSQSGQTYSVSVSQLNANLQTAINVPTGDLLGRHSTGAGAPESLSIGTGLAMNAGALVANGADHAGYPIQTAMSLTDDIVINNNNAPGLLPVTALRGLFSAGTNVSIDGSGVIAVTASAVTGPAGPQGAAGPAGPTGAIGPAGPTGSGLAAPAPGNTASSIGASDYVAIWQNGANAWMPYGQFLGGQTIDQLPAAGPAADSDELLVAQGSNSLSVQEFGSVWTYVQNKLPSFKPAVVELTGNTVLDATEHNNRILVASAALTLTANFANMGPGFSCTLINLAPGALSLGTGITSGSGNTSLPPGAATTLLGLAYSGGSLVWWSGVVSNAPTLTVASIPAPAPNTAFSVSGGVFNDAPSALDYSTDGGVTWIAAPSPVITANAYSFTATGLSAGTYTMRVRDHANTAVVGVSNNFTVSPPVVGINSLPASLVLGAALAVSGTVSPGSTAVRVGMSASNTVAPVGWVNATVSGGTWTSSFTPTTTGTVYIWAQQTAATSVQAISAAVSVTAASLTITAPATGTANAALGVSGTVSPAADAVNIQLSTQNAAAPTSGWSAATTTSGSFTGSLTPAAAGTYYAWAQDPATGLTAVSVAVTVAAAATITYGINNPGGTYVHGTSNIPINGAISPAQDVPTQVALSTSNSVVPTAGWQAALVIDSNSLWAIYYNTPASAGNYYVWVETAAGGSPAVSSFTVTVT